MRSLILEDVVRGAQLAAEGFTVIPFPEALEAAEDLAGVHRHLKGGLELDRFEADLTNPDAAYRQAAAAAVGARFDAPVSARFVRYQPFLRNFLCKWPGPNSDLYLHRDWMYVNECSGDRTYVVWIPLCDVDRVNGPLQVLPRSHHFDGSLRGTNLNAPWIRHSEVIAPHLVTVTANLGEAVIMDNALLHRSIPNLSDRARLVAAVGVRPVNVPLVHFRQDAGDAALRYDVDEQFFLTQTPQALMADAPRFNAIGSVVGTQCELGADDLALRLEQLGQGLPVTANNPSSKLGPTPTPTPAPTGTIEGAAATADEPRLLIVNADDFGVSPGICAGVLRAHEQGIVSSTSVLVTAPHLAAHVSSLRSSGLAAGCHLALTGDDAPLLSAREIPTLVERDGRLPATWRGFLRRAARGGVDPDDIRREFGAQLELFGQYGLTASHLDTHQNVHLWPTVATVVLDLAMGHGIGAIRLPRTATWTPRGVGIRALTASLESRAAAAEVVHPDGFVGLDEVGNLGPDALDGALQRLGALGGGSAEIVVHLGLDPDPHRPPHLNHMKWAAEYMAVCSPNASALVAAAGFRLGSYFDLPTPGRFGQADVAGTIRSKAASSTASSAHPT